MANIKILDESVANIIAAGEVVEDPSSLVKELVENSLDAKATKISIVVSNGGRNIAVSDNGSGMSKNDLLLCIKRHATSKIERKEDIFRLSTYGFRGEALASISHVARMAISSRSNEDIKGHRILVDAGSIADISEVGRDVGTDMIIEDLFFNVPARLKFLRRAERENSKIKSIVLKEALVNNNVSFNLRVDGKEVLRTSGAGIDNVILELFNKNVLQSLTKFELGYLGGINLVKGTKEYIFTFFNKRYAKSVMVEKAIVDGYYTKLPKGKYPFVILMIDIDPSIIDVNVHPSKKIVKFSNEVEIYKSVRKKIEDSIFANDRNIISSSVELKNDSTREWGVNKKGGNNIRSNLTFDDNVSPQAMKPGISTLNDMDQYIKNNGEDIKRRESVIGEDLPLQKEKGSSFSNIKEDQGGQSFEQKSVQQKITINEVEEKKIGKISTIPQREEKKIVDYFEKNRFVGQFANTFSIVDCGDKIEIYDQHIVQERVLYEDLKKKFYARQIQSQALLVPVKIDLEIMEKDAVMENIDIFNDFGFEIEEFSSRGILIRSVPAFDLRISVKDTLLALIQDIMAKSKEGVRDIREKVLITMSCKQSLKAGDEVPPERIKYLINELHKIGKYTCPHGRRIVVDIPLLYIEKQFSRK